MALFTCLSNVLCCICQPLGEEALTSLRAAAQDFFSFLRGWAVGEFNARRNAVLEVPVDSASLVGAEETLLEILNHLRDDRVGMVGIYGMGGIGKTALLRKINNHFFESGTRGMFNLVIWATVSSDLSIPKIQKQIGRRLGLSFTDSEPAVEEQAELLFQALSKKRFLLLLDDLWAELELVKVGIPVPKSHINCKVAFTSRSLQVCSDMSADKAVGVKLLNETQSWELFCRKFRTQSALQNPSIQPLARQVVRKCGGLPLALITVGKAMANRKLPNEWKHAIRALDHSAKELQGLDKVISCLKFSYANLENDKMRSALLYCAMYREDEDIERKELIDHWMGEGLLDVEDGVEDVDEHIDDARDRGHVLISNLQHACLLEAGIKDEDQYVRMHDAVRDMALWINNHEVGKVDGFYVLDGDNATRANMTQSRGRLIRRIWVRNSDLEGFPHDLGYPNICTLRVSVDRFYPVVKHSLLQGFFSFMPTLRVLNLSGSLLEELPVEIGLLVELRYLNLSYTDIESLPKELGGLDKLRHLEFQGTFSESLVVRVPREAIAGLSGLQVVNLYHAGLNWDTQVETKDSERDEGSQQHSNLADDVDGEGGLQLQLNDLEGLGRLQELHIQLKTSQSLERVLSSNKLCRCTRRLWLKRDWNRRKVRHAHDADYCLYKEDGALLRMVFDKMGSHLRELILGNMRHPWVGELRFDLNELPCLECLSIDHVNGYRTITIAGNTNECCSRNGDMTPSSGPSLKMLFIHNSDGWKELKFVGRFPSLGQIKLWRCLKMEELMLDDDDGVGTGRGERQGLPDSHFPMLKEMMFVNLPALSSIGKQPLLFPSLQTIYLSLCPRLRRLPLGPSSAPKLRAITCDQKLWDAIEWGNNDGQDTKLIFEPFFVPIDKILGI